MHEGERLCHNRPGVPAQSAASRSPPANDFAQTVGQSWKPSHSHPASTERKHHLKVTHIHSRHHPMRNNSNRRHPMYNRHSNRCPPICNSQRNNKTPSRKRSAPWASCFCYEVSVGAGMPVIDPNASAVAVVDALYCWSSCSFAWVYPPYIMPVEPPFRAFPKALTLAAAVATGTATARLQLSPQSLL